MIKKSNINLDRHKLFLIILFISPFIYLFPYILPLKIGDFDISVGNDFRTLYYNYKLYLLYFLDKYELPLWSPSEASGYPFYSNPFTQFFYPLNIPLLIIYKIFGGYSSVAHHRFTILGLSIFSLGIYYWLKVINIRSFSAFLSALITALSVGSLEMLRFPNAVHTLCWFPWILFAISKLFEINKKSEYVKYSIYLFFYLICLITGGYPYYIFYSIFLFVPYLIFYTFKNLRLKIYENTKENIKIPFLIIFLVVITVGFITYPYLESILELTSQTINRSGFSYGFSTASSESPFSTLGSFIYPPISAINTCFYFGLLNLLIIIIYYINKNKDGKHDIKKWILLIWILLLIYITYGSNSILFNFLWNYFPFFSRLREWGRLNKIITILIAWLLGYAYSNFILMLEQKKLQTKKVKLTTLFLTIGISIFILFSNLFKQYSQQWLEYFAKSKVNMINIFDLSLSQKINSILSNYGYIFLFFSIATLLLILLIYKTNIIFNKKKIFIFIIIFTLVEFYSFAPWIWVKAEKHRDDIAINIDNNIAFNSPRTFLYKTISLNNNFNAGTIADWYYKSYIDFLENYKGDSLNLFRILGVNNNNKLFFSSRINHPNLKSFFDDVDSIFANINVINYTGNLLEIEINTESNGYISFIDNYDEKWKAFVNEKNTNIERLFGTFKSVYLSKGFNKVKFIYSPNYYFIGFSVQ